MKKRETEGHGQTAGGKARWREKGMGRNTKGDGGRERETEREREREGQSVLFDLESESGNLSVLNTPTTL